MTGIKNVDLDYTGDWTEGLIKGDFAKRIERVRAQLKRMDAQAVLCTANPNLLYLTGGICDGFYYMPVEGEPVFFVRRGEPNVPVGRVIRVRKPEQIPSWLQGEGMPLPDRLALEDEDISQALYARLAGAFPKTQALPGSRALRLARSVKTPLELSLIAQGCQIQSEIIAGAAQLYREGMTDWDFACAVEYACRRKGHLGVFRTFGERMEAHMGTLLAGDNAAAVSPYDFALGGAGRHPSLPVGQCGAPIQEGQTVMVDISANYNGYLGDITRIFAKGVLPKEAYALHELSLQIQRELAQMGKPGACCAALYERALEIAREGGAQRCFMGLERQARFVGHGLGIQINELPVIAQTDTTLERGMVIALEPKFIVPGVGAVGTENTYVVMEEGMRLLTRCPQDILPL